MEIIYEEAVDSPFCVDEMFRTPQNKTFFVTFMSKIKENFRFILLATNKAFNPAFSTTEIVLIVL